VPVSGILPPQWAPKHVCVPGVWTNFVRIMVVTKRPQNGVYEAAFAYKVRPNHGDRDRYRDPLGPKEAGHRRGKISARLLSST
jgi:hypothetical protein